nr:ABC transporter permease [Citreicoccus inhibens]
MAFFEDVGSRNTLNFFATPLSIAEYVTGMVTSSIATGSVGLVVTWVLTTAGFGLSFSAYGLALLPFLLSLFLSGIALGVFGSARVLRFGPASEWFVWPSPSLLSPFAGVSHPVSTLPHWTQAISRVLPPSYVFEGMRTILAGEAFPASSLVWGTGLAVRHILLACGSSRASASTRCARG